VLVSILQLQILKGSKVNTCKVGSADFVSLAAGSIHFLPSWIGQYSVVDICMYFTSVLSSKKQLLATQIAGALCSCFA
jgi:hypothetical protein